MARSLWFVAGAGAGAYAVTRARRAAEALTTDGLRDRLSALAVGARLFRQEVHEGRVERESELRQRLHLVPNTGRDTGVDTLAGARYSTTEIASSDNKESSN